PKNTNTFASMSSAVTNGNVFAFSGRCSGRISIGRCGPGRASILPSRARLVRCGALWHKTRSPDHASKCMSRWRVPAAASTAVSTRVGFDRMRAERDERWRRRRPEVVRGLAAAAAEGDRSENAEYTYRKKQLGEI